MFSYPKPVKLIKHLLKIVDNKNAVVLDFFAGSGTTAHATLEVNHEDGGKRLFVLIEQMDYVESLTVERVKRSIQHFGYKSNFVYVELFELNQNYVKMIKKATDKSKLIEIWQLMSENAFLGYRYAESNRIAKEQIEKLTSEDLRKYLLDSLDNNMLYLPYTEIEDADYKIDSATIEHNKQFFGNTADG